MATFAVNQLLPLVDYTKRIFQIHCQVGGSLAVNQLCQPVMDYPMRTLEMMLNRKQERLQTTIRGRGSESLDRKTGKVH